MTYPRDFAVFIRYCTEFQRKIAARYPIPAPLSLEQFDEFLGGQAGKHPVKIFEHPIPAGVH